jgi:raffinose/stachyose/melibiose transport system substrate-binding protein
MFAKKKGLNLLAILVILLVTAGCGGAQSGTVETEEGVISLTMWDIPASEAYTSWWENYINEFNESQENINVKLEVFEIDAMRAKTLAALASDTAPDILYSQPYPEIRRSYREGKLHSLNEYFDAELIDPHAKEIVSVDGDLVGVPIMIAPTMMYYNKAQFAEAGIDPQNWANPQQPTWEEFTAAADALKAAGFTPVMLGNEPLFPGLMWYWSFHHRFGGYDDLTNAVSGENGGSFSSPAFIRAGELVQEMVEREYFISGFNGIGEDTMYSGWANGEGAMIYMGLWILGSLADAPADFEFGFFDFPSFSDGATCCQRTTQGGVEGFWVPKTSQHPEAVAEFFQSFFTADVAKDYSEKSGYLSPIVGVVPEGINEDSPMIFQVADYVRTGSEGLFSWYDHNMPAAVNEAQFSNIQALYTGDLAPGDFAALLEQAAEKER